MIKAITKAYAGGGPEQTTPRTEAIPPHPHPIWHDWLAPSAVIGLLLAIYPLIKMWRKRGKK